MKLKLDENFGNRLRQFFQTSGHEVHTVPDESLNGAPDERVLAACRQEQRCLITLDLDFANVIRFPPDKTAGIAVFRLPNNPTLSTLECLAQRFVSACERIDIRGRLWIVELHRIRIHQQGEQE